MKNLTILILCISLIFCGFTCNDQLNDLLPPETDTTAGMVLIPAGEVQIGLSQTQLERHNQQHYHATLQDLTTQRKPHLPAQALPQQTVHVDAFYIDTHEVTWEKYIAFVEASGYESPRVTHILNIFPNLTSKSGYFGNKPITQLSIAEMKAYAEFYGKAIPTEIEWEKAARGGLDDMNFPWGNEIAPHHANYNHAGIANAFSQ